RAQRGGGQPGAPAAGQNPPRGGRVKLGLAFVRSNLTRDNLQFARQCGVTHIVVHYTHYENDQDKLPARFQGAYGMQVDPPLWTYDELRALREMIESEIMPLFRLIIQRAQKLEQRSQLARTVGVNSHRAAGRAVAPADAQRQRT